MIRVENLSKQFKTNSKRQSFFQRNGSGKAIDAVSNVSFECKPGRVFSLLGANGAGKTTTLRLIATMLKPTSGSITVGGHDTLKTPKADDMSHAVTQ